MVCCETCKNHVLPSRLNICKCWLTRRICYSHLLNTAYRVGCYYASKNQASGEEGMVATVLSLFAHDALPKHGTLPDHGERHHSGDSEFESRPHCVGCNKNRETIHLCFRFASNQLSFIKCYDLCSMFASIALIFICCISPLYRKNVPLLFLKRVPVTWSIFRTFTRVSGFCHCSKDTIQMRKDRISIYLQ